MNYLALCKFTHRYIATGDAAPGTAPTTTVGQQGYLYEITQWVNDAYSDIQQDQQYWNWLRGRLTLSLSIGVDTYTQSVVQGTTSDYDYPIPMVSPEGTRYALVYDPAIGVGDQTFCFFIPYEDWRGWKDRGVKPSGKPGYFTVRPDKTIELIPTPDKAYTVTMDYRKTLDVLSGDTDTPLMPSQYHEAIAYLACHKWSMQRESPNKYQAFEREFNKVMDRMRIEQLPEIRLYEYEYGGTW